MSCLRYGPAAASMLQCELGFCCWVLQDSWGAWVAALPDAVHQCMASCVCTL
jgi:hypothetical protein